MTDRPAPADPRQRQMVVFGVALSLIFAVGIIGLVIIRAQMAAEATPTATAAPNNGVSVISTPYELTDFTLSGKDGEPLSLSDLRGRHTLMFFGYTHCPDICPLTLAEFRQIKRQLGDEAESINFLFVSVDGERDTPPVLNEYVNRFDSDFYAMQGDPQILESVSDDYGLRYQLHKGSVNDTDYPVDHSTSAYLVDPEGRLVAVIAYGTRAGIILEELRARL